MLPFDRFTLGEAYVLANFFCSLWFMFYIWKVRVKDLLTRSTRAGVLRGALGNSYFVIYG